ncbi:MAG: hypothetical protein AAB382_07130 [Chloroflexota bacterium]
MDRKLSYWTPVIVGAFLLAAAALMWPQAPAEAQCGSQASSCKNCHEVQGQLSVNADGTGWHQSHAFGDFCAFCHAGNVQATDKAAAHEGMVPPLSDITANCSSCHTNETEAKAQVYAAVLGVDVGTGGSGGATTDSGSTTGGSDAAPTEPAAQPASEQTALVGGPGVIDFNQQYAETVEGKTSVNVGNVVLGVLAAITAVGGGAFVYFNEKKLRAPIKPSATSTQPPAQIANRQQPAVIGDIRPEVAELLPQLQRLDARALRALKKITADPDVASELLHTVSRVDPQLVEEVRRLDRRELNLLMALAEEKP